MTSKLVVNTIEADTGISSVSFASSISMSSTSKFHFGNAGIDIGADTNINRPSAGVLGFNINSSEKVRITSAGKVGIGTNVGLSDILTVNDTNPKISMRDGGVERAFLHVDSSDDFIVNNKSISNLIFKTQDAERLRITSNGRVFIGESSVAGSARLVVGNGGAENFEFTSGMASSYEGGVLEYIHRGDGNTRPNLNFYVNNTGAHKFWTAGSERLRITSAGDINVHNTTAASSTDPVTLDLGGQFTANASITQANLKLKLYHNGSNGDAQGITASASGLSYVSSHTTDHIFYTVPSSINNLQERLRIHSNGNMTFQNSSTGATADLSSIIFANGNGEVAKIRGETRNGNTNGMITFHTDVSGSSSEKMRVNHDGGFCFGTDSSRTAEFSQPDGFSIRFDDKGQFQNSVSNTTGGYMNRKGSDGGILSFARQGTYVGEIGVNSSTIFLNFGGTNAAAHQLDDYEEGTWTPAIAFDVGGSGITYGSRAGSYVKIGRMVHLQYYMYISGGVSSSDYFARLALPFTGISVQHQDARIRQWNSGNSDWFVSLGGSNPVFFKNNSVGGGGSWARGDSVNQQVLSGQYTLYV